MMTVGAYEAKTHLPRLIEKVLQGETIQITRHGIPVAKLVPVTPRENSTSTVDELRRLRKGKRLNGIPMRDLISDGRE